MEFVLIVTSEMGVSWTGIIDDPLLWIIHWLIALGGECGMGGKGRGWWVGIMEPLIWFNSLMFVVQLEESCSEVEWNRDRVLLRNGRPVWWWGSVADGGIHPHPSVGMYHPTKCHQVQMSFLGNSFRGNPSRHLPWSYRRESPQSGSNSCCACRRTSAGSAERWVESVATSWISCWKKEETGRWLELLRSTLSRFRSKIPCLIGVWTLEETQMRLKTVRLEI